MTVLERTLVTTFAVGVWVLAAHLVFTSTPVAAEATGEPHLTREEVESIVEDWLNEDSATGGKDVIKAIIEDCLGSIDARVKVRMIC